MQYTIDNSGIQPSVDDLETIETSIGLTLSRFSSIITRCDVSFFNDSIHCEPNMVSCRLSVSLIKSPDFTVANTADSISESFPIALNRVKRSIERHLKRSKPSRMSMMPRTETG